MLKPSSLAKALVLPSSLAATLVLGSTYAWSVFVTPLAALTGRPKMDLQWPFTLFYLVFPATLLCAGMLLGRLGPRRMMLLGGLLFGGGWMVASLGRLHFAFTVAGIGLLGGCGVGLAYIVPIATCILWYPRHKGLITGLAVAGFGGGAALIAWLSGRLLTTHHWTPYAVFRVLGLGYLLLLMLAGVFLRNPPGFVPRPIRRGDAAGVLGHRRFWLLYLAMFAGLAAGLSVTPNLGLLAPLKNPEAGLRGVQIFALANALGRILWGFLFDRLTTRRAIRLNLAAQAATLLGAGWLLGSVPGYYVFALLCGLGYGGVLVIYASSTARIWGPERIGPVYGWLFSANIPAALAPLLVSRVYDRTHELVGALAVLGLGLALAALLARVEE